MSETSQELNSKTSLYHLVAAQLLLIECRKNIKSLKNDSLPLDLEQMV